MKKNKIVILLPMVLLVFINAYAMEDTIFEENVYDMVAQMCLAREENPSIDPRDLAQIRAVVRDMQTIEALFDMPTEKLEAAYSDDEERLALIRAEKRFIEECNPFKEPYDKARCEVLKKSRVLSNQLLREKGLDLAVELYSRDLHDE